MGPLRRGISTYTVLFLVIFTVVVVWGSVSRGFLIPAIKDFERGQITRSVAQADDAFENVCEGRSIGQEVSLSVPAKGLFLVYSCEELTTLVDKIVPINWRALPDDTVAGLKDKCQTVPGTGNHAVMAYGWDNSWDWWFYHSSNVEIKTELINCGKPVSAMVALGNGEYKRTIILTKDAAGAAKVAMARGVA